MTTIAKTSFWIVLALVSISAAIVGYQIDGDGFEYLIMAHAFASHGTASLQAADFSHVLHLLNGNFDPTTHALLVSAFEKLSSMPVATPYVGFARAESGDIYAIHFWLYSLMAAPFYAALAALGMKTWLSFPLLNLTLAGATLLHLHRALPGASRAGALVFLSFGTVTYLRWSGAEVLTACCAFAAAISVMRRDTSIAILLCGIGASQNPSLALFIPLIAAHRLVALRVPAIVTLPMVRRSAATELGLASAGIIVALSPYAFYYAAFGVPSVIAPYFTDPANITPRRALSFLFDPDQGALAGMPGLIIGVLGVAALRSALAKRIVAANGVFFLLASCVLAAPSLAAVNWNSGASGMLRYAYWAAMPLAAYFVAALPALPLTARIPLVSSVVVAQFAAILAGGLLQGETSFLRHTPLANWALASFPGQVNPDPEIFIERGRQSEAAIALDTTQVFYHNGVPVKLLRHWTNGDESAGLCPAGHQISAGSVVEVDRGWQYLNAPLACLAQAKRPSQLQLRFAGPNAAREPLSSGWWATEPAGTWTSGKHSVIRVRVPAGSDVTAVYFAGKYFVGVRASEIRINGQSAGLTSIADRQLDFPQGLAGDELVIELLHADAVSPHQLGLSADTRVIAYSLSGVYLRLRERPSAVAQVGAPPRPM